MPILYIMPNDDSLQDLTPSIEGNDVEDDTPPPPERLPSPGLTAFFDTVRANVASNEAIIAELYHTIQTAIPEQRRGPGHIPGLWAKYDLLAPPDLITPVERRRLDAATKTLIRQVEHKIRLVSAVIENEERMCIMGYYNLTSTVERQRVGRY
ncbi:hypothetical protein EYC80_010381 [Monilinia laxa]|uniref:Uncharacterized protein n=1 Tax=Monilinia laxa TaxID=61186 RepID=A0A5N6JNK0_MONLA|nr:hypothetical protein EYC80_010381 [Monilinia laxa]